MSLLQRLRALLSGNRVHQDMQDEMRFHLDMESDAGEKSGLSTTEARRQAKLAFGSEQRYREEGLEARGVSLWHDLGADLRYAVRVLRRTPVFTAVAVVTVGLGIGANTAIFSVVNTVLLKPLPYTDPGALVSVWDGGHSRAEFAGVRDRVKTLTSAAAYMPNWSMSLSGDGPPERIVTSLVSSDFFNVLGVTPQVGRFFRPGEDMPGVERVAVIGYGLWRDRFGADPSAVGRQIDLDGVKWTVVGVAPREFTFPEPGTRLWIPIDMNPKSPAYWGSYGNQLIGRLKPGVTKEQNVAEVRNLAAQLRMENPVWRPTEGYLEGITVSGLQDHLVKDSRRFLGVLLGAVGLVLLIACANVANLLIVRGSAREREIAIRATLGAGRRRITRQLLVEGVVLASIGGALAVALAVAGTGALMRLLPSATPRLSEVRVDAVTLGFTALLTLATGLLFSIAPSLRLAGTGGGAALAGGHASQSAHPRRLAGALVSTQIAFAVVLAIAAGLLARSLSRLLDVNPGFETVGIATARVSPPRAKYLAKPAQRAFHAQLLERVQAFPGVTSAAITTQLPFDQTSPIYAMWVDGYTTDPNVLELYEWRAITPDFLRTMGIPIRSGRNLDGRDREGTVPVALINETAAKKYWPGKSPIGGIIRFPWKDPLEVVGVVADIRNNDLKQAPMPTFYLAFEQFPQADAYVVASTPDNPGRALRAIRTIVGEISSDTPVSEDQTMDRLIERSVATPRSASLLLLSFGALALVLGAVGTYGLVAYGVARRTREIAVRLAVGAQPANVIGMVIKDGAKLAGAGILFGLLAALGLTRLMRSLLFETAPVDAVAFTTAPLVLAAAALAACLVPALRASRIDPALSLKE
ncbi:MAG TPA: ABC transporter permease [Gemmatimonadales bacterium]|nr:ABC transporter permease [Gemmatimonadales bacterium]